MLRTRNLTFCVLAFSLFVFSGCGPSATESDPNSMKRVISRVADGARDEERFTDLFASSATVPEDREAYGNFLYSVKGAKGDDKRTEVEVVIESNDAKEEMLGTFTWITMKENGEWKLVEAPLP
jgi:hypothetical protein